MAGTTDTKVSEFRLATWLELGFGRTDAETLVTTRGLDGFLLSHHDVRKYFAGGATHEQVMRIFAR